MDLSISSYTALQDYTFELKYIDTVQYVDITINSLKSIDSTTIKVTVKDSEKFFNENGETLSNREVDAVFNSIINQNSAVSQGLQKFASISKKIAPGIVYGSVGVIITSSALGFSVSSLAKIFIIIEFTAMLQLLNVRLNSTLELFLQGIYNLANIQIISFPTESIMNQDPSNSIGS